MSKQVLRFPLIDQPIEGNIVIFDFEVFKYDTFLGALVINTEGVFCYQTWSLEDIKKFYIENINAVWFGHNNKHYDNLILQAVIKDQNVYKVSKTLVTSEDRCPIQFRLKLNYIDLMKAAGRMPFYSLKMTEAASGKNISETEVDFDIDRQLTDEEKKLTESYNRDDLNQTYDNWVLLKPQWGLRFKLCKEFNLDISHIKDTEAQLGANVLGCHRIEDAQKQYWPPVWFDDLRIDTQPIKEYKEEKEIKKGEYIKTDLKTFYLNEEFKKGMHFKLDICGGTITGGSGGMHSAINQYYCKNALYFDVSGYYNLIMINKNLLPRGLDEEGIKRYIHCYHEQLRLKKVDPVMRGVYKIILLAVFGGENNEYTEFYDPWKGDLVMITGQLYITDLLQKLEGKIKLVQTNTDGIIVEPLDWEKRQDIIKIVEEWESRTGFVIKKVPIHNIFQRDVNNYIYTTEDGKIETKGEYGLYNSWENIFDRMTWSVKEPPIFSHIVVDFLINEILPEDTVEKYKRKLRMFQYLCKKGSFKYMKYIVKDETGNVKSETVLQNVNRCFAYNSITDNGMIYKYNDTKSSKYQSLPPNVFIYNDDINEEDHINDLLDKINWSYYIDTGYKKIKELIGM